MNDKYKIDKDHNITRFGECSLMEWAKWFETADRQVGFTVLPDGVKVSTVFLSIDHSLGNTATPILFETMIFGGPHDGYQERCSLYADAKTMHDVACSVATDRVLEVDPDLGLKI